MQLTRWMVAVGAGVVVAACGGADRVTGPGASPDADLAYTADGAQSAAGSVTLRAASNEWTFGIQWQFFSGADCTGTAGSVLSFPAVTSSGVTFSPTTWASMRVTAAAVSSAGDAFTQWSGPGGTVVTSATICISAQADAQVWTANYGQSVNTPPVLDAIGARSVDEGGTLEFAAAATDAETPAAGLTFVLGAEAPAGAGMTPAGQFTWTPGESDGPAVHAFNVCVRDDGDPVLTDCEAIAVTVNEVNEAPILDPIADQAAVGGAPVSFVARASDPDVPANGLVFSLSGAPAGAAIDAATGEFLWPQAIPGDFSFDVIVTDDGSPALSASRTVSVSVESVPPRITGLDPGDGTVIESGTTVDFTASFTAPGSGGSASCVTVAEAVSHGVIQGSSGNGTGTCTSSLAFGGAGSWTVTYSVIDGLGQFDSRTIDVVVYDPAGSVRANGWYETAVGAWQADSETSGKAIFNLVSEYPPGAVVPAGHVLFQVPDARFRFSGTTQEWLIVDVLTGTGSLRGTGSLADLPGLFGYRVLLEDGGNGQDRIRVVIWRGDDESDVVYDSEDLVDVGGGSVEITRSGVSPARKRS